VARGAVALAAALLAPLGASGTHAAELLSHGYFDGVQVTRPAGEPRNFVIWLGKPQQDEKAVRQLVERGSMVAHIDAARFTSRLEVDNGACLSADGALENLSRHIQAYHKLPTYLTPITVGDGPGAPLAYAMSVQAQPDAQVGSISLGFCPVLQTNKPMCPIAGLSMSKRADGPGFDVKPTPVLRSPWVAVQSPASADACNAQATREFTSRMPQAAVGAVPAAYWNDALAGAVASLARHQKLLAPPPASLADLPLVEVPATPGAPAFAKAGMAANLAASTNRMVILLSGDGGWAEIDKSLASSFADEGMPVVGLDSLRYFWSKRTPEGLAKDLDRVIRYYTARWNRSQVLLVGYSQGADVLPFAVNRLPAAAKARVRLTALLGLGQKASFEFHVTNWLGPSGDKPIAPEASRMSAGDTLCLHGDKEPHSLCPELPPSAVTSVQLPGNHHFNGAYAMLAQVISQHADKSGRGVAASEPAMRR
jgi:type IV secretory pathway VirJ component